MIAEERNYLQKVLMYLLSLKFDELIYYNQMSDRQIAIQMKEVIERYYAASAERPYFYNGENCAKNIYKLFGGRPPTHGRSKFNSEGRIRNK